MAQQPKSPELMVASPGNYSFAEYVWLGDNPDITIDIRSKTKVLKIKELPGMWNYDGSSTNQAPGADSEVVIRPVKVYPDPFRNPEKDILVLCENLKLDKDTGMMMPLEKNFRQKCVQIMDAASSENPRFGVEQEFFLVDTATNLPVGFSNNTDEVQGNFYCGTVGMFVDKKLRDFLERFLDNCRKAGIKLTGGNLEVAPGQLEYQVDSYGVDLADDIWMSRFICQRTAQEFDCFIDFSTRVIDGDWNGSGCHTNFSMNSMMKDGGWMWTKENVLPKLRDNHIKHLERYGSGNTARLSGKHETASWRNFSFGVASRAASIRIPTLTSMNGKGYIEDRRPSSAMNPYIVTSLLVQTSLNICPDIEFAKDMELKRTQSMNLEEEQPIFVKSKYRHRRMSRVIMTAEIQDNQ